MIRPGAPPLARAEKTLTELLSQLGQAPDPDVFARLYDRTSPTVYAWATVLQPDGAAAEQLVLTTYTMLWRDAARYPGRGQPWHWLLTHTLTAAGKITSSTTPTPRHTQALSQ